MSSSNDYRDEMPRGKLTDSNIERLLRRGEPGVSDDDIRRFIASLSIPEQPPQDVPTMATALAATAREARPAVGRKSFRRLAVLAGAGALVVALGGVALASDNSVPGDALYSVDRALEVIGIGDGGVDERIAEFDVLLAQGEEDQAYAMLATVIEIEDETDSLRAQRHLELAATKTNPSAISAQEKVAELQKFIEDNRGPEGINGKEFGQEVASIARSSGSEGSDTGLDDEAGQLGEPDPDGSPGNSENAPGQQNNDTEPGNSENAPGQQSQSNSSTQDAVEQDGDTEPGESRGNSENAPGQQEEDGSQTDSETSPGKSGSAPGRQKDN